MGADVRDLLGVAVRQDQRYAAMRDYCETVYRAIAEYVLDADETPADGTPAALTAENGRLCMAVNGGDSFDLLALLPQQYRGDVDAVEAELDGSSVWMKSRAMCVTSPKTCRPSSAARPRA